MTLSERDRRCYQFGRFHLYPGERLLLRDGEAVALTPKCFDTLVALVENRGRLVDKGELMKAVWPDSFVEEGNLTQNISLLRKSLGESAEGSSYIETIPRKGYRFVACTKDVRQEHDVELNLLERQREIVGQGERQAARTLLKTVPAPEESAFTRSESTVVDTGRNGKRRNAFFSGWGLVIALAVLAAAIIVVRFLESTSSVTVQAVTRFALTLPTGTRLAVRNGPALALTADGTRLVYAADIGTTTKLYLHTMDQFQDAPIPGTEGGVNPFFSPDGRWLAFFVAGKLKKIALGGGAPVALQDAPFNPGGNWGGSDMIVYNARIFSGLELSSAAGGAARMLTTLDTKQDELDHRWPEILPGDKALLFTIQARVGFRVASLSLETGERRVLIEDGSNAHYVPSGHLLFGRAGSVFAVPFDLKRLRVTGSPVLVMQGIANDPTTASMQMTVSNTGSLAYIAGRELKSGRQLVWVDRHGSTRPLLEAPRNYEEPRLSPDGQQAALTIREETADIWIYSITRGTLTRLTFEPTENETPAWTPDGKYVTFSASRSGRRRFLFQKAADDTGTGEQLIADTGADHYHIGSWSPDGQALIVNKHPSGDGDILLLTPGDRQTRPLVKTRFNERASRLSPNGCGLAYTSDESGRDEVYVQAYPSSGRKLQVSSEGGTEPVWARNSCELFYRSGDSMMTVSVVTNPALAVGKPRLLFEGAFEHSRQGEANYDVSLDGTRFLMVKVVEQERPATEINVVLNWIEELKRRVNTSRN